MNKIAPFCVKIHPNCGIALSKTDLIPFSTEPEVMEQNQFLGGDSQYIDPFSIRLRFSSFCCGRSRGDVITELRKSTLLEKKQPLKYIS